MDPKYASMADYVALARSAVDPKYASTAEYAAIARPVGGRVLKAPLLSTMETLRCQISESFPPVEVVGDCFTTCNIHTGHAGWAVNVQGSNFFLQCWFLELTVGAVVGCAISGPLFVILW